jgi:hypothetical protein
LLLFEAAADALWLVVLGDNPWLASAGIVLVGPLVAACAALWLGWLAPAYAAGRRQEAQPALTPRHCWAQWQLARCWCCWSGTGK